MAMDNPICRSKPFLKQNNKLPQTKKNHCTPKSPAKEDQVFHKDLVVQLSVWSLTLNMMAQLCEQNMFAYLIMADITIA